MEAKSIDNISLSGQKRWIFPIRKLDPKYSAAYHNRAIVKEMLEDYAGAIEDYSKVIALDPKDALAYYGRGKSKGSLKNYKGAIKAYDMAIKVWPY